MKTLITMIVMMLSLSAFAFDRGELDQLLISKGTTIAAFEAQGLQLIMGERTGGGAPMKFANIEVVFTRDEAFLKNEIQNARPVNVGTLRNLESIQAGGRHILASDIIGVIAK